MKVADWKAWLDGIYFIGKQGADPTGYCVLEIAELDSDLCCPQTLNWVVTSSDESIAKVQTFPGGKDICLMKPGKVRITVQSKDGHSFKYSWTVFATDKFADQVNPGDIGDENNFRVE